MVIFGRRPVGYGMDGYGHEVVSGPAINTRKYSRCPILDRACHPVLPGTEAGGSLSHTTGFEMNPDCPEQLPCLDT